MPRKLVLRKSLIKQCSERALQEHEVDQRHMRPLVRLGYVSMKLTKTGLRTYRATARGKKFLTQQEE